MVTYISHRFFTECILRPGFSENTVHRSTQYSEAVNVMMSESSFGRIGTALLIVISTAVGIGVVTADSAAAGASDADDTREHATEIDVSSRVNGKITPNDADWYAVDLESGSGFSALLKRTNKDGSNLRVSLYNGNGEPISAANRQSIRTDRSGNQATAQALGGVVERPGTYYVKVESAANSKKPTNYALTVSSPSLGEHDPNERRSQAASIESGETVTGAMTGYDQDVFSLQADAGGVISVKTSSDSSKSIDTVVVSGPGGEQIHRSNGNGVQQIPVKKSGRYTVKLASDHEATDAFSYTLTATVSTASTNSSPSADDAQRIEPGQTVRSSIGSSESNGDWYAVDLEKGQGFTVSLNHTNRKDPSEQMSFDVHDPNGNEIGEKPFDRPLNAYRTSPAATSAYGGDVVEKSGTYYINVTGTAGAAYSVTVDTAELDGNDPNEQPGSASTIKLGDTVSGVLTGYDRDVYAIDLQKGNTITVEYDSSGGFPPAFWAAGPSAGGESHSSKDYSFGKHTIAGSPTGNNLTFTANQTGTYYIKAVPYSERSTAGTFFRNTAYKMRVSGDGMKTLTHMQVNQTVPVSETVRLNASISTQSPTNTATTTPAQTTTSTLNTTDTESPSTATSTQPMTTNTRKNSGSTSTSTSTSTATDGPGFGVLAALVGLGVGGLWRRSRE